MAKYIAKKNIQWNGVLYSQGKPIEVSKEDIERANEHKYLVSEAELRKQAEEKAEIEKLSSMQYWKNKALAAEEKLATKTKKATTEEK